MSRRLRLLLLAAGLVAVVAVAGLALLPRLAGNGAVNIPIGAAGPRGDGYSAAYICGQLMASQSMLLF